MNMRPLQIRQLAFLRLEELLGLVFLIPGILAPFLLFGLREAAGAGVGDLTDNMLGSLLTLAFVLAFFWSIKHYPQRMIEARDFAPFLMVIAIYMRHHDLILLLNPQDMHQLLQRWDLAIFGVDPCVWAQGFYHPRLTDWFALSYLHYYLVTLVLVLILYIQGRRAAFRSVMTSMMMTYFIGFAGYLLFPAASPYLSFPQHFSVDIWQNTWFLSDWVRTIVNLSPERARDAFPSLHNAVTLLTLIMAWRYQRLFFWIQLPLAISLALATIYLRYHFAVDILAGVLVALAAVQLSPLAESWWSHKQESLIRNLEPEHA